MKRKALIIGASRGLGLGLVERLSEQAWQVTATVRSHANEEALHNAGVHSIEMLDLNDLSQMQSLAQRLDGQIFDLILVNAGVLGPKDQRASNASCGEVGQLFFTNSVAPIAVALALANQLRPQSGVLAFMSSRMGSVSNPDGTEMALYKASKAALNSMVNSLISEWAGPPVTCLSLHPGWVRTDLGGAGADIDVLTSTRGLIEQVERHTGRGGLHFIDYQGERVAW